MKKLATLVTKTRAAGDATPLVAARNPPTKICGNGKRDAQTAMGRCVVPGEEDVIQEVDHQGKKQKALAATKAWM